MDGFSRYLEDEGLERKTVLTYLNAVKLALDTDPREPWRILEPRRLAKRTKITYRAALKRWAAFRGDRDLLDILESRKVRKLMSVRGQKPPRKVLALTTDEVELFMERLGDYRNIEGDGSPEPWVWPLLSLMVKLALRANVDLTWISRQAAQEALRNRQVLTLVSKGGKERDVPCGHALDELEALSDLRGWKVVADLVAPDSGRPNDSAYEKIRRRMKTICREAGLDADAIHTHRFRKSAARWAYVRAREEGHPDPMGLVQQMLGHSSRRTTEIYLEVDLHEEVGDMLKRRFE